jgi:leader peptidase (prepilin peptidase)/N-methyltransferase
LAARYHAPVSIPVVVGAALAGAAWGMVLPGLVDRYAVTWPEGEPRPPWRRTCAHCDGGRPRWWRSSGPCAGCGRRPTPSRWVTVPVAAAGCGIVAASVRPSAALPAFLLLAAIAVPLALVDLKVLRLPDPLLGVALAGGVPLLVVAALADGSPGRLLRAGLAALACGALYVALALVPGSQLGFGDVKLGAVLGLFLGWLGWFPVAAAVVLAPLMNLPLVMALLVTGRANRKTPVPYGPGMLAAAVAAIVLTALR